MIHEAARSAPRSTAARAAAGARLVPRILVAEGSARSREPIISALRADGYEVVLVDAPSTPLSWIAAATRHARHEGLVAIVSDVSLADLTFLEATALASLARSVPLVVHGADERARDAALTVGAFAVLSQSLGLDDLRAAVRAACLRAARRKDDATGKCPLPATPARAG